MKTLVFCNQKGGVGKTNLAVHAVFYAQQLPASVCFIDLDTQANGTTVFLAQRAAPGHGASGLFSGGVEPVAVTERLSIIPADPPLSDIEKRPLEEMAAFRQQLSPLQGRFDYAVIDTPPTLGNRMVAALLAADFVIAPITPVGFALAGISDLLMTIQHLQTRNPRLVFLGMVINRVNSHSRVQQATIRTLRQQFGHYVMPGQIVERAPINDAIENGHPVWASASGDSARRGAEEMWDVMRAIFTKLRKG
jgi:chromosome partitioning protein